MTEQAISVWTRRKRGREQPALTREQIVAEAINLLDADGLDTLSMRNLGKQLGAGATSLYRHVANKDELMELVVDEVYGEIEVPAVDAADPRAWRVSAAVCANSTRAMILRHPWVASVLGQTGTSYLGPNMMRMTDQMLEVFEQAGFSLEEADLALSSLFSYVIGWGVSEAAWLTLLARSGLGERELTEQIEPVARQAAKNHPRLARLYELTVSAAGPETAADRFGYGLDRVLDGLQVRL